MEQFCGVTAINISIKLVAPSNQEVSLLSSELWLFGVRYRSVCSSKPYFILWMLKILILNLKEGENGPTYRIISGIIIISIAIVNLELFPVHN
jgi:hypothetical protein